MICKDIYIEKYDWMVHCYFAVDDYYTNEILMMLRYLDCSRNVYDKVSAKLRKGDKNAGFTYSNKSLRETLLVVGLATSSAEYVNSITHELRHLCDDISDVLEISSNGEEVAYLTGDVSGSLADIISLFVCDCPSCSYQRYKNIKYK